MGYMHLNNLYADQAVLTQKEVWALEKIHGTSAHIAYNKKLNQVTFFSGGEKHERFKALFDEAALVAKFAELCRGDKMTVYGEAYGDAMQRMSDTYGKELKFVAFDVLAGVEEEHWLSVPAAHDVVTKLGLEFVDYCKGPAEVEWLNEQRDRPSVQAVRNGITERREREGIVIRPMMELTMPSGRRMIAKHKGAAFCETKTVREVDPARAQVLKGAEAIAEEWVTPNRLEHVLGQLELDGVKLGIQDTGKVVDAMKRDVMREAKGEIVESKEALAAIGREAAKLFKKKVTSTLEPQGA